MKLLRKRAEEGRLADQQPATPEEGVRRVPHPSPHKTMRLGELGLGRRDSNFLRRMPIFGGPETARDGPWESLLAEAVRFELTDRLTGRLFSRQLG